MSRILFFYVACILTFIRRNLYEESQEQFLETPYVELNKNEIRDAHEPTALRTDIRQERNPSNHELNLPSNSSWSHPRTWIGWFTFVVMLLSIVRMKENKDRNSRIYKLRYKERLFFLMLFNLFLTIKWNKSNRFVVGVSNRCQIKGIRLLDL